jgi:hypothetical protein
VMTAEAGSGPARSGSPIPQAVRTMAAAKMAEVTPMAVPMRRAAWRRAEMTLPARPLLTIVLTGVN